MIESESKETIEGKIEYLAKHYSKKNQIEKCKEELKELLAELDNAIEINGEIVLPENTWSEVADVNIMTAQLMIQHNRKYTVIVQIKYKLNRQIERIRSERRVSDYQEMIRERILRTFLGGRN